MQTYHMILHIIGMSLLVYVLGRTAGVDVHGMSHPDTKPTATNMMMMTLYLIISGLLLYVAKG